MCLKINPLTGEVVQKLTPEVKVLCALGQKPEQKQNHQYGSSRFSRVHLLRFIAGLPLVDSSHYRRGAPQRQLSGEDDREKEQIGFLDVWKG